MAYYLLLLLLLRLFFFFWCYSEYDVTNRRPIHTVLDSTLERRGLVFNMLDSGSSGLRPSHRVVFLDKTLNYCGDSCHLVI